MNLVYVLRGDFVNEFDLVFYQKTNGDCPVGEFLYSLNNIMLNKMIAKLDVLQCYSNLPKGDFTKNLGDGIFEVRAQTKTDISRVLFFFDKNRKIILTNGFIKKSQRLPASELETAKKYRADYLARTKAAVLENSKVSHPQNDTRTSEWRPTLDEIMKNSRQKAEAQSKLFHSKQEIYER